MASKRTYKRKKQPQNKILSLLILVAVFGFIFGKVNKISKKI